jgi:Tol biopolymer transport system component
MFIETVPKRGYRFVAPLITVNEASGPEQIDFAEVEAGEEIHLVAEEAPETPSQNPRETVPTDFKNIASPDRHRVVALAALLIAVSAVAAVLVWKHTRAERLAAIFSPVEARTLDGVHTRAAVGLSPDGRYIAYARWDGQMSSLRLRQVANAGEVEILPPRRTNYTGLTFSPDGSDLYFVMNDEANPHSRSLYHMPVLGGPMQKLIEDVASPVSFSPDGRRFAFARFRAVNASLEIRTANADGTGEELFTQFPGYSLGCFLPQVGWSTDGRKIAVPFHSIGHSSLFTVDVATRKVDEVYSASGCIGQPAWTPDGGLMFSHEGELWMVKDGMVKDGLVKGGIARVRRLVGYGGKLNEQFAVSRDGKTAIATGDQSRKGLWMQSAASTLPTTQLISEDAALSSVDEMIDGKLLVMKVDSTIWTAKANGKDWQRLVNLRGFAIACGQFVVVMTDDHTLVRFNADGANRKTLVSSAVKTPTCSLKGDAVYYVTPNPPLRVMRVSIDGGDPVSIAKIAESAVTLLRISPDGNLLAYASYDGKKPKSSLSVTVLRAKDAGIVSKSESAHIGAWDFYWAPDGKALDYVSAGDGWTDVWEVPLAGGEAKRITHFQSGQTSDFHWSRDGKRLLVVWGPTSDDVVVLSGLR